MPEKFSPTYTGKTEVAYLTKDGKRIGNAQYRTSVSIACALLSGLMPQHDWDMDVIEIAVPIKPKRERKPKQSKQKTDRPVTAELFDELQSQVDAMNAKLPPLTDEQIAAARNRGTRVD